MALNPACSNRCLDQLSYLQYLSNDATGPRRSAEPHLRLFCLKSSNTSHARLSHSYCNSQHVDGLINLQDYCDPNTVALLHTRTDSSVLLRCTTVGQAASCTTPVPPCSLMQPWCWRLVVVDWQSNPPPDCSPRQVVDFAFSRRSADRRSPVPHHLWDVPPPNWAPGSSLTRS